ncbi:MAG TPA: DMT family transporter [Bacillales bacterium]
MRLYAALISLSLIWGTSFLFIKVLVSYTEPWEIVFLRCLLGAIPLYVILIVKTTKETWRNLPWRALLIAGVLNAAIPWTLIALSETTIKSSTAAVLNATTPIWTSLMGFALFSVFLAKRQWIGILIGFIGILILMDFDLSGFLSENFVGVGTMILAPLCYGFSNQFVKRFLGEVPVLIIAAGTLTVGYILTGIFSVATSGFPTHVFTSWEPLLSILVLGVFGSGIAYLLNFYMIQKGGPEFASFVTYLVPISAMFWGWFILDEPLSAHLIIGLLFIFGGVYLSGKKTKKKTTASESEEKVRAAK